jgi:Tfp pilus assembly PilM family ATPase
MNLFQKFNAPVFAGLALHQDRLSMVKVRQYKKKTRIEAFAVADIPEEWFAEGKIRQADVLSRIIQELTKKLKLENCYMALSLPMPQVIQKRIQLAACLNEAEREAAILENITHYLPGLNEPLRFDYSCLAKRGEEEEFLLVAARQELINTYLAITAQANLKVRIIDIDIYALARALSVTQEAKIFFDLDATLGHLVLWAGGEILAVQQILINTNDEGLIQQLKRALQSLYSALSGAQIDKIILTGKKYCFSKFVAFLHQEIGVQTKMGSVLHRFEMSEQINRKELYQYESELLAVLGLVLRRCPKW